MSYKMADPSITIRVKPDIKTEIQRLVDIGEYRSITDYVDKAIREKFERDSLGIPPIEEIKTMIERTKKIEEVVSKYEMRFLEIESKLK